MSTIIPGLGDKLAEVEEQQEPRQELMLTYRHWFVISLLVFFNVMIFGCIFLAATGKIRWGF